MVSEWKYCFLLPVLFIVVFQTKAQEIIIVESDITQNTTWVSGNTYIIKADIKVNPSRTLTIEPGVKVLFDFERELLISGTLIVQGAENDSVLFAPNYSSPIETWKWQGIRFDGLSLNNVVSYSDFENALYAISIPISTISQIEISNSTFRESQIGLKLDGSGVLVQDCYFVNNDRGAYIRGSNNVLRNNIFKRHVWAVVIERSGVCRNNLIENNLIGDNIIGIEVGRSSTQFNSLGTNSISQNVLYSNSSAGMLIYQDSTIVANNIFWINEQAINLLKAKNTLITQNTFYENRNGIRYVPFAGIGSANNVLTQNTFSSTSDSLIVFRSSPQKEFRQNNFFANDSPVFYNFTPQQISVAENWWGTTDADIINTILWDQLDDPNLGLLLYDPFLTEPDTVAPVSPPLNALKRPVNGNIIVSWDPNPESDIAGYKIYYGGFSNYTFEHVVDVGLSLSAELHQLTISDTVAVTAYDHSGSKSRSQFLGHESAFAFTKKAPYAGPDTSVCKNSATFKAEFAVVYDHDDLYWTTGGDGSFDNSGLLHPTYTPGTGDLENGSVILTITVVDGTDIQSDSFLLAFISDPVAWAGNDTIIYPDSSYHLLEATAAYFDHILWLSSGDGTFDNPNVLNPVYTPGNEDMINGWAELFLLAESGCGLTIDTLILGIERYASLRGRVHAGKNPMTSGVVIAFIDYQDQFKAHKITSVNESGDFVFPTLIRANYYLYAVPDKTEHPFSLPGYYLSNLLWQDAYLLPLYGDAYDLDLRLPAGPETFPAGEGIISGYFNYPPSGVVEWDIYGRDWFGETGNEPDPYTYSPQNITVLLFSKNLDIPLGFTLSDENGHFKFDNLPFGSYRVIVEKPGFISMPSLPLSLSPENPVQDDLMVTIEPKIIRVDFINKNESMPDFKIYPNPAHDIISIEHNLSSAISSVNILNIRSQHILSHEIVSSPGNTGKRTSINIATLTPGFYIIKITTHENQSYFFRFIKH